MTLSSAGPAAPGRAAWAHAACAWMAVSFVWHAWMAVDYRDTMGGEDGGMSVAVFLVYDGAVTAASLAGALLALATVRPWGARLPLWAVRPPLWFGCALLTLRGVPGAVEAVTTASGLTPKGLLGRAEELADRGSPEFWQSLAINSYFFLGAALLVPAVVVFERRLRVRGTAPAPRTG
ncbi:hypothetical protein GCM10027168_28430 [Streptomyces capparidis]